MRVTKQYDGHDIGHHQRYEACQQAENEETP